MLFFQPRHHDELLDPDPHMLDDFNVDNDVEDVDDWVSDKHIVELSQKNTSKISEAMAIEVSSLWFPKTLTQLCSQRPTWAHVGPSSILSAGGSTSIQSVTGRSLMQGVIGRPFSTVSVGGSTPSTPSVSGLISSQSFGGPSRASSIDIPSALPSTPTNSGASSQDIRTTPTPGLHHL